MRYAAIDVGSNSCRLLVADMVNGRIKPICQELQSTRLGAGVNAGHKLGPEAMERTLDCLKDYTGRIERLKVDSCRAVATSAMREAFNRKEFQTMVKGACGLVLEVIDGEEEARLSYRGVKEGLTLEQVPLVADLGGGSCEFRLEESHERFSLSLPLGAVRATEADLSVIDIKNILAPVAADRDRFKEYPLVLVGGTATTLVAMKLSLEIYDPKQVHGQILSREEVADLYDMLILTPLDLRRRLPGLQAERADIIPAGAGIILLIMDALGRQEIRVSESDILEGIIRQLHKGADAPG
ncbi:Ppx/GppA phosphatase family protein [Syntrophomonas curvata]